MKKKKLIIVLLFILVVLSSIFLYVTVRFDLFKNTEEVVVVPEEKEETKPEIDDKYTKLRQRWNANKQINDDYVGEIVFDSGIIDLSFVKADDVYDSNGNQYIFYDIDGNVITDMEEGCDGYSCSGNDVYLWTYWKTMEYDKFDNGGSVFMDYRNSLNDENLIIYGHHFSIEYNPERDKAFTCLENFVNKDYYEDNKYLSLVLDGEIRRYEIASVYRCDIYDEAAEYYRTSYNYDFDGYEDPGYKERYFEHIKDIEYYDTGVDLNGGDYTLTLQTCFSGEPDYREILVCKQIEVIRG